MTLNELYTALSAICPLAYMVFLQPQNLPFMVYGSPSRDDFMADNEHYYKVTDYWLEYYSKQPDEIDKARIEGIFTQNKISYSREGEQYIDDQKMFICVYNFQLGE